MWLSTAARSVASRAGAPSGFCSLTPRRVPTNISRASLGQALRLNEVHYTMARVPSTGWRFTTAETMHCESGRLVTGLKERFFRPHTAAWSSTGPRQERCRGRLRGEGPNAGLPAQWRFGMLQAELLDRPEGEGSVQAFPDGGNEWFTVVKGH